MTRYVPAGRPLYLVVAAAALNYISAPATATLAPQGSRRSSLEEGLYVLAYPLPRLKLYTGVEPMGIFGRTRDQFELRPGPFGDPYGVAV
jgi:hypothetical protein